MIGIIDYGVGNVEAYLSLFKRLGIKVSRANSNYTIEEADKLILPGVGHFDYAITKLEQSGLKKKLESSVLEQKKPVAGVCVGMQMLAETSEEGNLPGLGWITGKVRSFKNNEKYQNYPLPHMGWNKINVLKSTETRLVEQNNNDEFYFLHSYYFEASDRSNVIATSSYGFEFDTIVSSGNIFGFQFHPEKSHSSGEQLLRNYSLI